MSATVTADPAGEPSRTPAHDNTVGSVRSDRSGAAGARSDRRPAHHDVRSTDRTIDHRRRHRSPAAVDPHDRDRPHRRLARCRPGRPAGRRDRRARRDRRRGWGAGRASTASAAAHHRRGHRGGHRGRGGDGGAIARRRTCAAAAVDEPHARQRPAQSRAPADDVTPQPAGVDVDRGRHAQSSSSEHRDEARACRNGAR